MIFNLYFLFPNLMIVILVFGYSIVAVCRSIRPFVSKLAYFYNIVLNFIQAFFSECCILDKHDVKNLNNDYFKSLFGELNYTLKLFYVKMFFLCAAVCWFYNHLVQYCTTTEPPPPPPA